MRVAASAPGKLVVLGEYAVLSGAPALVVAVDRRCRVEIGPSDDSDCHLVTEAADRREVRFRVGSPSGEALLDLVSAGSDAAGAWRANVDSRPFFAGQYKLGIGSSAAVLTAWASAWATYAGDQAPSRNARGLSRLIDLHREFQGGSGSGLDVAASLLGGTIVYRLLPDATPSVSSVRLPDGVGFTCVFTGRSASTQSLLAAFETWRGEQVEAATERLDRLAHIAETGCSAAIDNDATRFVDALAAYGRELEALGTAVGAEIVTPEHREIARHSERLDVVYKISGAGGGDLGIAVSTDPDALAEFRQAVEAKYRVIAFDVAPMGLTTEEQSD